MVRFLSRTLCLILLTMFGSLSLQAQIKSAQQLFDQENLVAWCIVPFDSKNRSPEERIEMLKRLSFSQYAYDWRHQHLDSFANEIRLAEDNHVNIVAVWLWIDKNADKPGQLSEDNERMLDILEKSGLKTALWVGFNHNYFEQTDDADKVSAGAEMIKYLRVRTGKFVTTVGLYNHGDWFGNPLNQLKIVNRLQDPNVGIVYNFHHAHAQIDDFSSIVAAIKPYLLTVNLNGMRRSGPQILPIGSGDEENKMLQTLTAAGYNGPIGILGHIETEDVEVVLKRNLDGLKKLTQDFIVLKKGGGITGNTTVFRLSRSGEVEKGSGSIEPELTESARLRKSKTKKYFRKTGSLLNSLAFNHPGNVYTSIALVQGGRENSIVWGDSTYETPPDVRKLYQKMFTTLNRLTFHKDIRK